MGKQRLRKWIMNNPFFQYQGQFSKSAFIAMSTWFLVLVKYLMAGMAFGVSTVERVIGGHVIPALSWAWTISFNGEASIALLTTCFALYFGGKFSPKTNGKAEDERDQRRDIREDAAAERKDIREDAAQDRKDIREGKGA